MEKERDVSPHTLKAYRRDLDELLEYLASYYGANTWTWQGIDRLAIRGFLAHLTRRKLSKRTIARALSAVRSFYTYLHRNEVVEANPARGVSSPKLERYLPGYLDRAQIELLFQSAELKAQDGKFVDVRNNAIVELFYSTGMRLSELRGINRGDLDLLSQQVKVRGKGRKERIIPVGDHAQLALRNYEYKRDDLIRNEIPYNPLDLLLSEHTRFASTAGHLPLECNKLFLLTLRLIRGQHATKQVALGRPFTLREPFVLPRQSRTYQESEY